MSLWAHERVWLPNCLSRFRRFQCVVTAIVCWGLGIAGRNAEPGTFLHQFPELRLNKAVVMSVLKLSFIFVGMITFNNLCEPLLGSEAAAHLTRRCLLCLCH